MQSSVKLARFKGTDKIEFLDSKIYKGNAFQRNPLIAHVPYLCGKIEKWGRGTVDMIQDCKRVGNPLPQFEEIGGSFFVMLPFKESSRTVIYSKKL